MESSHWFKGQFIGTSQDQPMYIYCWFPADLPIQRTKRTGASLCDGMGTYGSFQHTSSIILAVTVTPAQIE